jgi:hypothetical protein
MIVKIFKKVKSFLFQALVFFFSIFFTFIIFPLCLLAGFHFYIYRFFVIFIVKLFRPDLTSILTTTTTTFASEEIYKDQKIILTVSLFLEGVPEIKLLRERFESVNNLKNEKNGLPFYPEMCQNIKHLLGFPFFRRLKKVDIKELVHFYKNDGKDLSKVLNNLS